ncbi:MAG: response regulator [Sulfuricellaceae bacterium]
MTPYQISPFYFPSTVMLVDDNIDFLKNLSLKLDPRLAFRLYDSPVDALVKLNGTNNQTAPVRRFFSRYYETEDLPPAHHVIDVNLGNIHREVYNECRFEQVSVVVVDYDMPNINGIEFCKNIKNPDIMKVLLTGKADEKIAVDAFNDGCIHCYITKQDKDVISKLNQAIAELQRAYFSQTERLLADALAIGKPAFLRDPVFAGKFREICDKLHIVEYYLCGAPDSILMLDADGASSLLIIQNEDAHVGQYEIAYDQGAPQALLDALKSNRVVSYFWRNEGYYIPECHNWQDFLYPATEFKGEHWYCYTIVKNPQLFKTHTVLSYNKFLDELDQRK